MSEGTADTPRGGARPSSAHRPASASRSRPGSAPKSRSEAPPRPQRDHELGIYEDDYDEETSSTSSSARSPTPLSPVSSTTTEEFEPDDSPRTRSLAPVSTDAAGSAAHDPDDDKEAVAQSGGGDCTPVGAPSPAPSSSNPSLVPPPPPPPQARHSEADWRPTEQADVQAESPKPPLTPTTPLDRPPSGRSTPRSSLPTTPRPNRSASFRAQQPAVPSQRRQSTDSGHDGTAPSAHSQDGTPSVSQQSARGADVAVAADESRRSSDDSCGTSSGSQHEEAGERSNENGTGGDEQQPCDDDVTPQAHEHRRQKTLAEAEAARQAEARRNRQKEREAAAERQRQRDAAELAEQQEEQERLHREQRRALETEEVKVRATWAQGERDHRKVLREGEQSEAADATAAQESRQHREAAKQEEQRRKFEEQVAAAQRSEQEGRRQMESEEDDARGSIGQKEQKERDEEAERLAAEQQKRLQEQAQLATQAEHGDPQPGQQRRYGYTEWKPGVPGAPILPKASRWAGVNLGDNIVVVGGIVHSHPSASIFAFNFATKMWKPLGPGAGDVRPTPVAGHTLSLFRENSTMALLVGGGSAHPFLLDTASLGWRAVPAFSLGAEGRDPNDRRHHVAVSLDGDVFVFGGHTRHGLTNLVDKYLGSTGRWESLSVSGTDGGVVAAEGTAPPPLSHASAGLLGGRLMVFGGKDSRGDHLGAVHLFDFQARRWACDVDCGEAPTPRSGHGATTTSDGTMYVFGGCTGFNEYSNDLWAIDDATLQWRRVTLPVDTPSRAYGLLAVRCPPKKSEARQTPPPVKAEHSYEDDFEDSDEDRSASEGEEDSGGAPPLAFLGGGALPEKGSSRYAQLVFTPSDSFLLLGFDCRTEPSRRADARPIDQHRQQQQQNGSLSPSARGHSARGGARQPARPVSAPTSRGVPVGREMPARTNAAADRRRADSQAPVEGRRWNLARDFPPAPPIKGRENHSPPKTVAPETLQRLHRSRNDREAKLEKIREQMQGPRQPRVVRSLAEAREAGTRLSTKAAARHDAKMVELREKAIARPAARKMTAEEEEMLTTQLYTRDVRRFREAFRTANKKYAFVPPDTVKSTSTREEINHRLYRAPKSHVDARVSTLRAKYIRDPPTRELAPEEVQEMVSRLAKQPS